MGNNSLDNKINYVKKSRKYVTPRQVASGIKKRNLSFDVLNGMDITDYVVIDFETTGLKPETDRITKFTILKYTNNQLINEFSFLVNPHTTISVFATNKSNISFDEIKRANDIDFYIDHIIDIVKNAVVVGHNVNFELEFLAAEIVRCKRTNQKVTLSYVDTYEISKSLFSKAYNHKLDTLQRYMKINVDGNKMNKDALAINELFAIIKDKCKKNKVNKPVKYEGKYSIPSTMIKFNDMEHLNNHINYLFRTDKKQKWTTKSTKKNMCINFYNNAITFKNLGDMEACFEEKDDLFVLMNYLAETNNQSFEEFVEHLYMFRSDYLDNDAKYLTKKLLEESKTFVEYTLNKNGAYKPLVGMLHADQPENYLHLHIIFYKD